MGWIGWVRCKMFRCDFVARTFALIAPVQPVLHRVSCSNETIQNAPKHYKMHQYMSFDSNEGDRVCSLWKFRCDFMAQTWALIAPFQPVLHRVLCSNETLPNAPKHYETHQNMSIGFNWVDRMHSFWKILTRLHGTNLCINSTISACFASTFV